MALAAFLVGVGVQIALPAAAAPRPLGSSVPHTTGRLAGPSPLSWGNVELKSNDGRKYAWHGATTSLGSNSHSLVAVIPNTGSLPPASSFRVSLTLPVGQRITPGTSYMFSIHAGVSAQFGDDDGLACFFEQPGSFLHVDQYVVDASDVVTAFAIRFQCVAEAGLQGSWSGTMAYNAVPSTPHEGYYLYRQNGALSGFGNDNFLTYLGDLSSNILANPIVGMVTTSDGGGYWMVASDGGVFALGDARYFGSMGGSPLNRPVVGMAAAHDGMGYWLVASDGGIFAFGDAAFEGSMGGLPLNRPIVGMASSTSAGYWLVASDGGIFSFGGATFHGSTGGIRLNRPVVGMAPTSDTGGYWMVASDGGVFTFGDATFHGSTGAFTLQAPITGMDPTADDSGYWLGASDGGVFSFDAPFLGSLGGQGLADVVGVVS